MRNICICISYNGTAYHGWQRQSNNITVQQVFEDTLGKILNNKVCVHGCSRTDAGVHARSFFLSFVTDNPVPCRSLARALNSMLPDDIAVISCEEKDEAFHARFSAVGKEYVYIVNNAGYKNVFAGRLSYFYPYKLDEKRLDAASKLFIGEHDFSAFCKAEAKAHLSSTVRTVYDFSVTRQEDNEVRFTVSGNGFLHNMVRIMVGTLIYINENKRSEQDITESFSSGRRDLAGITIPACGLYLNKVFY